MSRPRGCTTSRRRSPASGTSRRSRPASASSASTSTRPIAAVIERAQRVEEGSPVVVLPTAPPRSRRPRRRGRARDRRCRAGVPAAGVVVANEDPHTPYRAIPQGDRTLLMFTQDGFREALQRENSSDTALKNWLDDMRLEIETLRKVREAASKGSREGRSEGSREGRSEGSRDKRSEGSRGRGRSGNEGPGSIPDRSSRSSGRSRGGR